jgi:hypothetical protein
MKSIIKALEENIYENKSHKIDKTNLAKYIEQYLKKEKDIEEILR